MFGALGCHQDRRQPWPRMYRAALPTRACTRCQHTHVHAHTDTQARAHTSIHSLLLRPSMHGTTRCQCTSACKHMHAHTHTRTHAHMRKHTTTHTHIHTRTRTLTRTRTRTRTRSHQLPTHRRAGTHARTHTSTRAHCITPCHLDTVASGNITHLTTRQRSHTRSAACIPAVHNHGGIANRSNVWAMRDVSDQRTWLCSRSTGSVPLVGR